MDSLCCDGSLLVIRRNNGGDWSGRSAMAKKVGNYIECLASVPQTIAGNCMTRELNS